jgi:uncharacterized delta-60 repeat protein
MLKSNRRKRALLSTLVVLVVTAALPLLARAAAGDLDPSFDGDGIVVTDFGANETASALAIQPDGKIVVAGGADGDIVVARYLPSGAVDSGFGSGGVVRTDLGGFESASGVAVDATGRVVVVGSTAPAGAFASDAVVARYLPSGSLDPAFASGGVFKKDFGSPLDVLIGVAVRPDGRVVAGGRTGSAPPRLVEDMLLIGLDANGAPDLSFGTGGAVITDLGTVTDRVHALVLDSLGRVIVGGMTLDASAQPVSMVARYMAGGSLDPAFGAGGVVVTDLGPGFDRVMSVALAPSGKLVAGASASSTHDVGIVRYLGDGSLDPAFGAGGIVVSDFGSIEGVYGVAVQPDGAIVAAGDARTDTFHFSVLRYRPDGSLDPAWGNGGRVLTDFGGQSAAFAVGLDAAGRAVVAGWTGRAATDFALARYDTAAPAPVACAGGSGQLANSTRATFGFQARHDAKRKKLAGWLVYHDKATGAKLRSVRHTSLAGAGDTATIRGIGVTGSGATVEYTLAVADGPDSFEMSWPGYSTSGALKKGNVAVPC